MNRSILRSLHESAGARLLDPAEPRDLLTYGDVPAEYAAATTGAALVDETARGAVRARGPEAGDFLHRMLSCDVHALEVGESARGMLLSPKGKVRFVFDLSRVGREEYVISTEPGEAPALAEALEAYHFTEDLSIEDVSEEFAPIGLLGPRRAEILGAVLGVEPPEEGGIAVEGRLGDLPVRVAPTVLAGSRAFRLEAGPSGAEALWRALTEAGARPIGRVVWDSLRVEAGWAQPGEDVDESIYPQEARLEPAFSLDKGCYVGQEVVAKIDTYGGLNKRLVGLALSHDEPVARGTRLLGEPEADGTPRDLGVITSWAYSFARDGGMALGYVKRKHQAPGTRLTLGDGFGEAEIVALPVRADAVPPGGDPD